VQFSRLLRTLMPIACAIFLVVLELGNQAAFGQEDAPNPSMTAGAQAASAPAQQDEQSAALVRHVCSACHDLSRVTEVRETRDGWTGIVNDMRQRGAKATDDEFQKIIDYLATHLAPGSSNPTGLESPFGAVPAIRPPATPAQTPTYQSFCASCHGVAMAGGTGPSILDYVRYHDNTEVAQQIREHHTDALHELTDEQMRQVLADVRALAGTDPRMATAGYTGRRPAGAETGLTPIVITAPPANDATAARMKMMGRAPTPLVVTPHLATIALAGGRTLTGTLMAYSDFDAVLFADGKAHLLSKNGETYREKPIEPAANWLTYNGTPASWRYSPLDQINTQSVHQLSVAWMFPMPNSQRLEVTPVVADGIMYVTGWNEIFALDATTGRALWTYSEPRHPGLLSEAGSGANRGAGIQGDRVFMVTDHAHLLAFNRFTGQKLWDTAVGSITDGYSATAAPLPIGDLVVQGLAGGEEGARGMLVAVNANTGEIAWRFYTIPKRGEKAAETWKGQAIDHGCGATWQTGSYDPDLGLVYWGVGNPCPDYIGDERLGDNLYTSSVVAVSAKTGQLKWYYQFSPHDTHDWDGAQPMVLVDAIWKGRPRKLLMNGNRDGIFYVLDRTNGQVLLTSNLSTKVTWEKGFTPDGKPIVDPASIATPQGVVACPGSNGGANMPPPTYDPMTKLFYDRVADSCGVYASGEDPLSRSRWFGYGAPTEGARDTLAAILKDYPTRFYIRAMDPFTGKKVWDYRVEYGHEGLMSTAGGLVFAGSNAGGLMALDARTGAPVWHINIGQTGSQAAPMTYMVGGKQYITLAETGVIVTYALPPSGTAATKQTLTMRSGKK
jgi:alcohol dehydrogenase (cytochrome c)